MYQGVQIIGTWWLTSRKTDNDCEFIYFLDFDFYYVGKELTENQL